MLGDALEAEPVAGRLRPRERGDDRYAVLRPVLAKRGASVAVPLLHRVWHVHVKAEVGREDAVVAAQNAQVRARRVPKPLELVIIDEEMAALAALVGGGRALRVIEALQLVGLHVRPLELREAVPAAIEPRDQIEVVRAVGLQPFGPVFELLALEVETEAAHVEVLQAPNLLAQHRLVVGRDVARLVVGDSERLDLIFREVVAVLDLGVGYLVPAERLARSHAGVPEHDDGFLSRFQADRAAQPELLDGLRDLRNRLLVVPCVALVGDYVGNEHLTCTFP